MLNEISRETSLHVQLIAFFNYSLSTGEVPDSFKESHVVLYQKGGDSSDISNHRSISLLSNIDKALQRLVFKYLYNHFRGNNIITSFQSGFTPGDATVNQFIYLYNTFCHALDSGKEVQVVFCDISKAFDRVWHAGLIHKLRAPGISVKQLKWFLSYLENRKKTYSFPGSPVKLELYSRWSPPRFYLRSAIVSTLYQ